MSKLAKSNWELLPESWPVIPSPPAPSASDRSHVVFNGHGLILVLSEKPLLFFFLLVSFCPNEVNPNLGGRRLHIVQKIKAGV